MNLLLSRYMHIFSNHRNSKTIKLIYSLLFLCISLHISAQVKVNEEPVYKDKYDVGAPINAMKIIVRSCSDTNGDIIPLFELPNIYIFPDMRFKNNRQREKYTRLVRNVKRTLPIAKTINGIIIETYEYLQTIPTKKERDNHLEDVEKGLMKQYKPEMKKLTYSQGKLLIKLVDRECDSRAYDLIKAFMGSFKAGVYNAFASIFGASLKKTFDPDEDNDDKTVERICILVENGQI